MFQLEEEDFLTHIWPRMSETFKGKALSLELLWLILEINSKFPNVFNKERTYEIFERKKLIGQELIKDVAEMLMVRFLSEFSLDIWNVLSVNSG